MIYNFFFNLSVVIIQFLCIVEKISKKDAKAGSQARNNDGPKTTDSNAGLCNLHCVLSNCITHIFLKMLLKTNFIILSRISEQNKTTPRAIEQKMSRDKSKDTNRNSNQKHTKGNNHFWLRL